MAYVNLGVIKIDLDKLSEAEDLFLRAIKINQNYNYAYRSLFSLYEKTNNIKKLKNKMEEFNDNESIINEILMFKARIFLEKKLHKSKKIN